MANFEYIFYLYDKYIILMLIGGIVLSGYLIILFALFYNWCFLRFVSYVGSGISFQGGQLKDD